MKNAKKLIRCMLAMTMAISLVMALAVTTVAAAGDINVNAPSNISILGKEFEAYRVFDATVIGTGGDTQYAYTLVAAFADFDDYPNSSGQTLLQYLDSDPSASALVTLTKALWDYIDEEGISPSGRAAASTAGSVKIPALPMGYYLVYSEDLAALESVDGTPVVAAAILTTNDVLGTPGVTINLKADAPTIEKELWDGTDWGEEVTLEIGDTVQYKLTSAVPYMEGYSSYTFNVRDTLSPGLAFDNSSLEVQIGGEVVTSYTLTEPATGPTFLIEFNPITFLTYTTGALIEITYSAEVTTDAVIGSAGNSNSVTLEYSNNPYTAGTGTTPPEETEVYVYLYEFKIYKYTGVLDEPSEIPLSGAKFQLRTSEANAATALDFTVVGSVYTVDRDNTASSVNEIESPANGVIEVKGLAAGTYYLIETAPPSGFDLIIDPILILVTAVDDDGAYTVTEGDSHHPQVIIIDVDGDNDPIVPIINVQNLAGGILPDTGGVGRDIFIIVGVSLMLGAGILLLVIKGHGSGRNGSGKQKL